MSVGANFPRYTPVFATSTSTRASETKVPVICAVWWNREEAKTHRAERIAGGGGRETRGEPLLFLSRYRSTPIDGSAVDFFVLFAPASAFSSPFDTEALPNSARSVSYRARLRRRTWAPRYDAKSKSSSLRVREWHVNFSNWEFISRIFIISRLLLHMNDVFISSYRGYRIV